MAQINLGRNTRLFFSTRSLVNGLAPSTMTPGNTWEILPLAGSSVTYSPATVSVSGVESGILPDRSSKTFLTSVNPVDFSFTSYIRPTDASFVSLDGDIKPVADWFLWQALVSNNALTNGTSVWTYGGNLTVGEGSAGYRNGAYSVNFPVPPSVNHLYVNLDNVIYQASNVTINSVVLDAGIDGIATSTWTGQAIELDELTGTTRDNAISVFGGVYANGTSEPAVAMSNSVATAGSYHSYNRMYGMSELPNPYIKNKLSEISFNYRGTDYSFPVTAFSFTYDNNITYITPETIGILNTPIGAFTGTRAISGTASAYLRNTDSGALLRSILANTATRSASFANAQIYIGGNTYPRMSITVPSITFSFPSIAVDDYITTNFEWVAQQNGYTTGEQVVVGASLAANVDASIVNVFTSANEGAWWDFRDKATLYQDSAASIPVTAAGQPVGYVTDKSGSGQDLIQPTSGKRPIYSIRPSTGVRNIQAGSAAYTNTSYWPASSTTNGITATKGSTGIDTDGLPYVEVRYTGTPTAAGTTTTMNITAGNNPAVAGEIYTLSGYAQIVAGSLTGVVRATLSLFEQTAPNTSLFSYASTATQTVGGPAVFLSTTSAAFTTGNQVGSRVSLTTAIGTPIDITIRWKGIQLEKSSTPTAWQQNISPYEIYEANSYSLAGLTADGIDDSLYTASTFTFNPGVTAFGTTAGVIKTAGSGTGVLLELSSNVETNANSFAIIGDVGTVEWVAYNKGSANLSSASLDGVAYTAGNPIALDMFITTSIDTLQLRANTSAATTNTSVDLGTQNFTTDLYTAYVFSRNGNTLPFSGFCPGIFIHRTAGNRTPVSFQMAKDVGMY